MTRASDIAHDNKVFELGQSFVAAYNDWAKAVKEHGSMSHDAYEKLRIVENIQKRIKRMQAQDRRRNATTRR